MTHARWQRLFDIARTQAGVVTLRDVVAAGLPMSTFRDRARREDWQRQFPGTWLIPGAPASPQAARWSAVLANQPNASISHGTAATVHELERAQHVAPIHVLVPYGRRADPAPGLVQHRSRRLGPDDIARVDGLPVTTIPRTIMDLAAGMPTWRIEAMMLTARQRGGLDIEEVVHQHERRPGLHGARRYLAAARLLAEDGADSILERRTRQLVTEAGFSPSSGPHAVDCPGGVLHVDIAFPSHRFGIECDGFGPHGTRRAFERDRERWRRLQQAGWRLTWVTWHLLHTDPTAVLAEVRTALAA